MKTAIVTGGTGFVGAHLVSELLARGVAVTALCREGSGNLDRLPKGVTVAFRADDLKKADVFYHLAWEGASGPGRADALLQTKGAQMTLEALKTAHGLGCGKFVCTGTVYENFGRQMAEAPAFRGAAFYILSKRYARDAARQLAFQLGIGFAWCTFCHPVGRHMKPEQMLANTIIQLLKNESPAFGAGLDYFDIIAAEDLAAGLYLAGETALTETDCYIGSGAARTLKDWLEAARAAIGAETPIAYNARPDDGMRFDAAWFDAAPFHAATGFTPKISFEEAARTVRDYFAGR